VLVNSVPHIPREALSAYFSSLGLKGGSKGGKARARNLGPRRRRAIAKKAARARWRKARKGRAQG
jgi:hypothetical protein